jgi:hypothetical protein
VSWSGSWLSPGRHSSRRSAPRLEGARPAAVGGDRRACSRRWRDRQARRIDPGRLCAAVREPLTGSSEISVRGAQPARSWREKARGRPSTDRSPTTRVLGPAEARSRAPSDPKRARSRTCAGSDREPRDARAWEVSVKVRLGRARSRGLSTPLSRARMWGRFRGSSAPTEGGGLGWNGRLRAMETECRQRSRRRERQSFDRTRTHQLRGQLLGQCGNFE